MFTGKFILSWFLGLLSVALFIYTILLFATEALNPAGAPSSFQEASTQIQLEHPLVHEKELSNQSMTVQALTMKGHAFFNVRVLFTDRQYPTAVIAVRHNGAHWTIEHVSYQQSRCGYWALIKECAISSRTFLVGQIAEVVLNGYHFLVAPGQDYPFISVPWR